MSRAGEHLVLVYVVGERTFAKRGDGGHHAFVVNDMVDQPLEQINRPPPGCERRDHDRCFVRWHDAHYPRYLVGENRQHSGVGPCWANSLARYGRSYRGNCLRGRCPLPALVWCAGRNAAEAADYPFLRNVGGASHSRGQSHGSSR